MLESHYFSLFTSMSNEAHFFFHCFYGYGTSLLKDVVEMRLEESIYKSLSFRYVYGW